MDDLRNIRRRLTELVEEKLARAAALRAEADAIDAELVEAQAMLGFAPAPVADVDDVARRRLEHKEKRERPVIKMPRTAVIAHLAAVGPQEAQRILEHFGLGPRGGAVFSVWVNGGFLVRHADGRLAVPDRPALHVVGA